MSNESAGSLSEQLTLTANPAVSTQTETRRDEISAVQKPASSSGEEFTLSSLEGAASPLVADGKRPLEAPAPIADARQSQDSPAISTSFTQASPGDKVVDLADLPKGASSQYREKYAAVMRDFRDGKLQIVVKDRSVAIAIAAEQATRVEAGPQQKEASSTPGDRPLVGRSLVGVDTEIKA